LVRLRGGKETEEMEKEEWKEGKEGRRVGGWGQWMGEKREEREVVGDRRCEGCWNKSKGVGEEGWGNGRVRGKREGGDREEIGDRRWGRDEDGRWR